uniref:Uncharacterized protein n=1 Tax=Rhizophora mucronata TaxID=61149 RepID=A0A2P2QYB5_RHIMU
MQQTTSLEAKLMLCSVVAQMQQSYPSDWEALWHAEHCLRGMMILPKLQDLGI